MNPLKTFITILIFGPLFLGHSDKHNIEEFYSPKTTTIYYKLGDKTVPIKISRYGESSELVMLNLHDDEYTSVSAAKKFLEREGGILINIKNNNKRNIRFKLRRQTYNFDPNRIFSRQGIIEALKAEGNVSEPAIEEVERFAERLLALLPENPSCIIALHNNTDGNFSVNSYTEGNPRSVDAKAVYVNPEQDPDDLFLTTDRNLYDQLAEKKFNVILQDNARANKDGSLSVYCGEKGLCYLNCETEHGKTTQYLEMLTAAASLLERAR